MIFLKKIEAAVFISGSLYQAPSGGIHLWHMPALTEIFGDDYLLQFGGGTLGHPWGNAPGAVANLLLLCNDWHITVNE